MAWLAVSCFLAVCGPGACAIVVNEAEFSPPDGANVWVANYFSGNVMKVRARDGAAVGTFPVGDGAAGVTFDGTNVWVTSNATNTGRALRAADGAAVAAFATGHRPYQVVHDGSNIWLANSGGDSVSTSMWVQ